MDFDKFPYVIAQKAALDSVWQAPATLSCEACKKLSGGVRAAPMPEAINLMAFGPAMSSAEYSDSSIEAMTVRLGAAQALFRAASKGKVLVYGQRCERVTKGFMGPPMVQCLAPFGQREIVAAEFADDKLTLSPVNMNWICLASVVAKPELWAQPDDWRHAENVCYFNLEVGRASLSKWIGEVLRTKARYKTTKQDMIIRSADAIGAAALDGLQVQERNTLIENKASELTGKKFTADPKTIREALRRR